MKCVYEAGNGVEAHMIAHMLAQHDIETRIDGEYLTSGVGELPAAGLVRVMAEERHYERARQIIREWEAKSPPTPKPREQRRSFGAAWFLFGIAVTIGAMSWFDRERTLPQGVDFDGDGRLDEHFIYSNGSLS